MNFAPQCYKAVTDQYNIYRSMLFLALQKMVVATAKVCHLTVRKGLLFLLSPIFNMNIIAYSCHVLHSHCGLQVMKFYLSFQKL